MRNSWIRFKNWNNLCKGLFGATIIAVSLNEAIGTTEWGTINSDFIDALNEVFKPDDLKDSQKDYAPLWDRISAVPHSVGNILAYKTTANTWYLLESGISGSNLHRVSGVGSNIKPWLTLLPKFSVYQKIN